MRKTGFRRWWIGGLILHAAVCLLVGCTRGERWNVVVVTVDTTRADHLGCYGYTRAQTPRMDQLAREGVLFENAYTAVPITLPSHSTIMTGKVPFVHGVRDNGLFVLSPRETTLAEVLQQRGYHTAAAIGAFPLKSNFGLNQGFDLYDDHLVPEYEDLYGNRAVLKRRLFFDERRAAQVNEAVLPWLEEHHNEPFFLWLHYFDAHQPYAPPPPFRYAFADDPYSGEIAYADENLGILIDHLRRLGVYDRTILVVTADHGDGLGEHDEETHSLLLYNSTLHVPLIMRVPGAAAGRRVERRVGAVDIMPTILGVLGIEVPNGIQGESLTPWLNPSAVPSVPPPPLYAETLSPRLGFESAELRALYDGNYKYIHGPQPELYEVTKDPSELRNLAVDEPERALRMRHGLEGYLQAHAVAQASAAVAIDETTASRLMALGYLLDAGARPEVGSEVLRDGGASPHDRVLENNLLSRAKQFLANGEALRAKAALDDLLLRAPGNAAYLNLRVEAEGQLGNLDDALATLETILATPRQVTVTRHEVLRRMAAILYRQGQTQEALERMRQSEQLEASAPGRYWMAMVHDELEKPDEAFSDLSKAVQLDPTFVPALLDLAIRYARRGESDKARETFLRALDEEPYHARSFYNYGAFLAERGQRADAIGLLKRAVHLQPSYVLAYHSLIRLLIESGEDQVAGTTTSTRTGSVSPARKVLFRAS